MFHNDIIVVITFTDLGEFVFPRGRHHSEWADSDQFVVRVYKGGKRRKELDGQDIQKEGVKPFSLRLCITPYCVGGAMVMMGAIPLSLQELKDSYPNYESTSHSPGEADCGWSQAHHYVRAGSQGETRARCGDRSVPVSLLQHRHCRGLLPEDDGSSGVGQSVPESSQGTTTNRSAITIMAKLGDPTEFTRDMEAPRLWPLPQEDSGSGSNDGDGE